MRNKFSLFLLIAAILCMAAAVGLYVNYQHEGQTAERDVEELRTLYQHSEAIAIATRRPNATFAPAGETVEAVQNDETTQTTTSTQSDGDAVSVPAAQTSQEGETAQSTTMTQLAEGVGLTDEEIIAALSDEYMVASEVDPQAEEGTTSANAGEEVSASEPEPFVLDPEQILPEFRELYARNNEVIGWLKIDGTNIDYPVLQTKSPQFYLKHDFYGNRNANGNLIITPDYDVFTPSQILIIHGHNMRNGKMFNNLLYYESSSYGLKRKDIRFDTLLEGRKYRVVSAFYTKIYGDDEEGFRYYVKPESERHMRYFVEGIRRSSKYDFGEEFDETDEYLVLSTCAYHTREGRFVVVAKRVYE